MTASTRLGLATLGAALLLGLLGDALLRPTPWGLNLPLWVLTLCAAFWALRRVQTDTVPAMERRLLAGLLGFSLLFAWRDSATLKTLDLLSIVVVLSLLAGRTQPVPSALSGVGRLLRGFLLVPVRALIGAGTLLRRDIGWATVPRTGWSRHGTAVARGLAVAVPLLIFFGGLLAAADPVFSHFVGLAFQWDPTALCGHIALVALIATLAAGLLHICLFVPAAAPTDTTPTMPRLTLGLVETATILALLDLLFLSFVLIQLRCFFGGAALVRATVGLTYAQYARQGFFELVAVAALVLPLLLGLHAAQRPGDGRAQSLFRLLAGGQVVLLFVIMASAALRMRLYQNEYGLTELRLYTSAFIGWLAVVFLWFAATVLRGARARFAFGALLAAFGAVLVLHLVNPDAAIVRANLAHARGGHPFDAAYAASLSADAVPTLAAALPALPVADQARVRQDLQTEVQTLQREDWRSWSVSRLQAEATR